MLRRFTPHIVIGCVVLASLGVWVQKIVWVPKIMPDSYVDPRAARSCAELLSLYSAPYRPTVSGAVGTTMRMCDFSVQFYDVEEALIRRVESPDNPCAHVLDADRLKGRHGLTLLDRIWSCHAAAVDPAPDVKGGILVVMVDGTPISEVQPCEELHKSLVQDAPSERAFQAFKAHPTEKNHCDFLLEVSDTEQAIINRFERASLHCGELDRLKIIHAKTLETQTKVCDAAAVDPGGLGTHP